MTDPEMLYRVNLKMVTMTTGALFVHIDVNGCIDLDLGCEGEDIVVFESYAAVGSWCSDAVFMVCAVNVDVA